MLRLECPWCGERDETEFHCGGQSHISRPGPSAEVSNGDWGDYLYVRDNPKGWHFERWCHVAGCGQWFNVARHAVTHEIAGSYKMGEPRPEVKS